MTTSAEDILALTQSNQNLLAFFQGEQDRLEAARLGLQGLMYKVIYVDEANGLPGNPGSATEPYDSIDTAIESVRNGQSARICLLSDCTIRKRHFAQMRQIEFLGWAAGANDVVLRDLTFDNATAEDADIVPGFTTGGFGSFLFRHLNVTLATGAPPLASSAHFAGTGFMLFNFLGSTIIGTGGSIPLIFNWSSAGAFGMSSATFTAMAGRWFTHIPSGTAITDANSRFTNATLLPNS